MDSINKLTSIRYPGNVVNHERALETLGGLVDISTTIDSTNRRLELRFRPEDSYCNPTCGDRHQTAGLLLRIRIKKSRREKLEKESQTKKPDEKSNVSMENSSSHNCEKTCINVEDEPVNKLGNKIIKYSVTSQSPENKFDISLRNIPPTFDKSRYENLSEDTDYQLPKLKILGRVETEFRFTSLCDFQYLPITKNLQDPSKDECIYNSIYPVGLPPYSWLKEEVPYFLPPAAFSRMDSVQQYTPKTEVISTEEQYVIGKTRKRRAGFSNFIGFNTPHVPTNPPTGIETAMKVKFLQSSHVEKIRKFFKERPIWSKTALMYVSKFSNEQLKILLPAVAYYFMTGPWRITWVRLGYDPRKDPESRIYQILDYRLKAMHGLHANITCKRNYAIYTLPYKNAASSKAKAMVLMPTGKLQSEKKQKMMDENVYIYKQGVIPPSRQMFYQYCDLHVKKIQDMLEKYIGPPPGTPCHEKLGWLPVGFDDLCREIINKQVRVELRKLLNIPENLPTTLPRKRKFEITGRLQKRNKKKKKEEKPNTEPQYQQPAAMSIIDDDDMIASDEDGWEDILEEGNISENESDIENGDEDNDGNGNDNDNDNDSGN